MEFLARRSAERPWAAIGVVALLIALLGAGALRLKTETGYRAALGAEHESVRRLDAFINDFGGGLSIEVAWECTVDLECETALDPEFLDAAVRIEAAVSAVPGFRKLHSPSNTPVLVSDSEGIRSTTILEASSDEERAALVAAALSDSLWVGTLVSPDGMTAALLVEVESSNPDAYGAVSKAVIEAVKVEGWPSYALVGDPIDFAEGGSRLNEEAKRLGSIALVIVVAVILIMFRNAKAVVPALVTVGGATAATVGLMGWSGWSENEVSQALVPLLLVVGICGVIHFLSRFRDLAEGRSDLSPSERQSIVVATGSDVARPCLIASATTAAALGSFALSDLAAFAHFGIAAGAGVFFALGLTFTAVPAIIMVLRMDLRILEASRGWLAVLDEMSAATRRRPLAIVAVSTLLMVGSLFGVGRLEVDVSKESLLGTNSPVVAWHRWIEERLHSPDTLEVRLSLGASAHLGEPETLRAVDDVARSLETIPQLGKATSVVDYMSHADALIRDLPDGSSELPASRPAAEELLMVLSMFEDDPLSRWTTFDRSSLRISVDAENLSKDERHELLAAVRQQIESEIPDGWSYELTGPLPVFADMVSALHATQLNSFVAAFVLVSLVVAIFLRSLTAAAWIMVPTLLPVLLTLGAMGFAGVPLDTGTAMVAAIVIGVAVDDSVHLVVRYRSHRDKGADRASAMDAAVREVGRALVASSAALSAGFLALLLSSWGGLASFGFLASMAIALALVADLLFLPALVYSVARASKGDDP